MRDKTSTGLELLTVDDLKVTETSIIYSEQLSILFIFSVMYYLVLTLFK